MSSNFFFFRFVTYRTPSAAVVDPDWNVYKPDQSGCSVSSPEAAVAAKVSVPSKCPVDERLHVNGEMLKYSFVSICITVK